MTTDVSTIESIIKRNINDETQKSIAQLKEQIEIQTQQAVERINNIYGSAINTLKQLELTDATIFDFFQKTNGNIRVFEMRNDYSGLINIDLPDGQRLDPRNSIYLKKAKYKIIIMAMNLGEETE